MRAAIPGKDADDTSGKSFVRNGKMHFTVVIALLVTTCGLYLSGYLTLRLLHLDGGLLRWHSYLDYVRAIGLPQVRPYVGRIKAAGFLGFGVPLFAGLALLVPVLRPARKAIHGNARFATARDLARRGLFKPSPDGIIVGRFNGKLLRLSGQQSVVLAAPTRSGKGVGVVVPNLLEYQESMVVLDIKQENFNLTSGWRARQGQDVYLFNPFAEDRRTHRWNPLSYVADDPAFRVSDLMGIAAMLYLDGADEQKFWVSQARNAFLAFALYLFENRDDARQTGFPGAAGAPTLGAVYRLSSGDGTGLKSYLQALSRSQFLSGNGRSAFATLLSSADETFASILGTFKEPLNAWINPVLDAATSADDFLLTELRRKPMTIYVGIQPSKLAESRLIVNLFFNQVINLNTRELPQDNPRLKHQCLLLMDEFTAIGKLDIIASAIGYMAGYNLRLLPIIQSMAQLDATYGKEVARTLLTNHALQIVFAPREQRDANDYSEMLGYTTVRRQNITRGRDTSRSESEERRALMLPQELKAMGADKQVLLYEGMPQPVLCDKIRYYQDQHFTARLLPKAAVPTLHL
jgi:type IV secretion system protein VirD4